MMQVIMIFLVGILSFHSVAFTNLVPFVNTDSVVFTHE